MQRICIIANQIKDPDGQYASEVLLACEGEGLTAYIAPAPVRDSGFAYVDPCAIEHDTDLLIVLGGDGTLMGVIRDTKDLSIPLLGVNIGKLGYLTEVSKTQIPLAVKQLRNGAYVIENRMMLHAELSENGRITGEDLAVNDVVFGRMGQTQLTQLNLYVNGALLHCYEADGLIISTPTGSTAYNLSAGGPVVEPTASMFAVTPICPHTLGLRSIVLSGEDILEVEVGRNLRHPESTVGVTFDGEPMVPLAPESRVVITRANEIITLLKLSDRSFVDTLRMKMQS